MVLHVLRRGAQKHVCSWENRNIHIKNRSGSDKSKQIRKTCPLIGPFKGALVRVMLGLFDFLLVLLFGWHSCHILADCGLQKSSLLGIMLADFVDSVSKKGAEIQASKMMHFGF